MSEPRYRDLPMLGGLDVRSARDVLPPELGTLARIDADLVRSAATDVAAGLPIPLNLAVDAFRPPLFGRSPLVHRIVEPARNEAEDVFDGFNPQASSQLDGLAHVRAREFGFFDGSTDLDTARAAIGMQHWARRGIVARGVLLDATGLLDDPFAGRPLTAPELRDLAEAQGVEVRRGDVLIVRTGWAARYLAASEDERATISSWPGLSAGHDLVEFLWDSGIALIGCDNPAVENAPGDPAAGSLHRRLLPALGMPMLELLDLERLAEECRARGRWDFLFVSVPMYAEGAVSSPANAVAIL